MQWVLQIRAQWWRKLGFVEAHNGGGGIKAGELGNAIIESGAQFDWGVIEKVLKIELIFLRIFNFLYFTKKNLNICIFIF